VVNQDLTPEMCNGVGRALGTMLPPDSSVCLATDSRLSRELIKNAVISGLLECGINVADIEIAPTPALALLTREMGFDAGVMITASHNPPEFNGIKLFNSDSIGFDRRQEEQIESIYYSGKFRTGKSGKLERLPRMKAMYFDYIASHLAGCDFNRGLKLMIDPGNGAASGFATDVFTRLGFHVIPINDTPDGRFPGRNPEPKEDTLKETIAFLRQKNADLAVCFDGDADRVVFCDQQGFLGFNEMIAFIARHLIKATGKKIIATTVETGTLLDLAIADVGGSVIRGKVGDVYAAHLARDNGAALGVESVGVYIIPQVGFYPDSIFAAITLLAAIKEVSEIRGFFKAIPGLFFSKDKLSCPNEHKPSVMAGVKGKAAALKPSAVNDLDGLRLEFGDAWMLIRASGTEPAIRVLAESKDANLTSQLLSQGLTLVKETIEGVMK